MKISVFKLFSLISLISIWAKEIKILYPHEKKHKMSIERNSFVGIKLSFTFKTKNFLRKRFPNNIGHTLFCLCSYLLFFYDFSKDFLSNINTRSCGSEWKMEWRFFFMFFKKEYDFFSLIDFIFVYERYGVSLLSLWTINSWIHFLKNEILNKWINFYLAFVFQSNCFIAVKT